MPSPKRERQRAGRQSRQEELLRQQRARAKRKKIVAGAVVAVLALVAIYLVSQPRSASKPGRKKSAQARLSTSSSKPVPCPEANGSSSRRTSFPAAPPTCIHLAKSYVATVRTDVGTFSIALATKSSPKTVNDFVYLARYHFYDGLIFHRVIPGFVVQAGDPNPPTASNLNPSGPQGPGFSVAGEVPQPGGYRLGTVAMAKASSDPAGTAASQFFIVSGTQGEQLPPLYSVLGRVKSGMSVVQTISKDGSASGTPPSKTHKILSITIASS